MFEHTVTVVTKEGHCGACPLLLPSEAISCGLFGVRLCFDHNTCTYLRCSACKKAEVAAEKKKHLHL